MKQCILTVGVSASGKTTWANETVNAFLKAGEDWVNINRDEIRAEVFYRMTGDINFSWHKWKMKWEKIVTEQWEIAIQKVIDSKHILGVIISDTNLNPKTRILLETTFGNANWQVKYQFFDISYEEAVKRDLQRENPVGSSVIAEQIEKYWNQFGERYVPDPKLTKAVIVDIDGTLAHHHGVRNIFEWDKVDLDKPDPLVIEVVRGLKAQGIYIVITSGRDDVCREKTWNWLIDNMGFMPSALYMRVTGDTRKDCIVKREIFFRDIAPKYNVIGAIDDRPQVVRLWHSLGIRVLACGLQHKEF
jgi:predicted kinase